MKLVEYSDFGALRLAHFLIGQMVAENTENWEFMGQIWVGEVLGFTQWLRLKDDPQVLRSIALDLDALPKIVSTSVLDRIGLPLLPGMKAEDILVTCGSPTTRKLMGGKTTYSFSLGKGAAYRLRCTTTSTSGLSYLVIMRTDFDLPSFLKAAFGEI